MLGERIKRYRKEKGYSQKQLAEKLDVAQTAVSSWETGVRMPGIDTIMWIADALDVSYHELLRNERPKETVEAEQKKPDAIEDDEAYARYAEIMEAAELAADTAMYRKLERVPDKYLLDRLIEDFNQMNKIGKYELFKYAELLLERETGNRFSGS